MPFLFMYTRLVYCFISIFFFPLSLLIITFTSLQYFFFLLLFLATEAQTDQRHFKHKQMSRRVPREERDEMTVLRREIEESQLIE